MRATGREHLITAGIKYSDEKANGADAETKQN